MRKIVICLSLCLLSATVLFAETEEPSLQQRIADVERMITRNPTRNYRVERDWLQPIAERGDIYAQYVLAQIYDKTSHCYDYSDSVLWYNKAAESGHTQARERLEVILNQLGITRCIKGSLAHICGFAPSDGNVITFWIVIGVLFLTGGLGLPVALITIVLGIFLC